MKNWLLPCLLLDLFGLAATPVNALPPPVFGTEGANPVARRDIPFELVQTGQSEDHSGAKGDPAEKYFHESIFHYHYDGRFANNVVEEIDRIPTLTTLVQTYLSTMASIGAETWIMHGSLLGWYWNQQIMPWDTDIDVQVSMTAIESLATIHNATIFYFELPEDVDARDTVETQEESSNLREYLLEVNPHYRNSSTADSLNVIDARWIDMKTGLFIDITAVRPNTTASELGIEGQLMCKDKHNYHEADIFPLRSSTFEGVPVKVPFAYSELLIEEYGQKSLSTATFEGHLFDPRTQRWLVMYPTEGEDNVPPVRPVPIPRGSRKVRLTFVGFNF